MTRLAIAVAAVAVFASSGFAATTAQTETYLQSVTFIQHGLEPWTQYAATFEVYDSPGDPFSYWLGHGETWVKPNGTISISVDADQLDPWGYGISGVRMWLRTPGTPVTAPPPAEAPSVVTVQLGYETHEDEGEYIRPTKLRRVLS